MSFRARLSVFALEQRENPSVPALDPIGGVTTPTTPTTPTDPLLGNNPIYQIPLVP